MFVRSGSSRWLSVLAVAVSVSAQNASVVPKSRVHPQSTSEAARDNRPFHLMVINMSGQRRQVLAGKTQINLPIGHSVTLDWTPGDTLHIVSDTDSRVNEWVDVSRAEMMRPVAIH